jgi:glycine/D-amino acid oxidase-like deaminating enzyme
MFNIAFMDTRDSIIVGGGISGCILAWTLHLQGKSFYWFVDRRPSSSHVAAGVFNPVVLKRFSPVWKAQEQIDIAHGFYEEVSRELGVQVAHTIEIWRRLHDEKERRTWIRKSQREDLANFMKSSLVTQDVNGMHAPFGYGVVEQTGWLDTNLFIEKSIQYFKSSHSVVEHTVYHRDIEITSLINYEDCKAKKIIFAEGFAMRDNPYFKELPLQGNKGELLIIQCPGLKLSQIIKSSVFLMPIKDDLFWVGATYDRDDLENAPTTRGRGFLEERLQRFLQLPYTVLKHQSGIRPTTMDRRPLTGRHPNFENLLIFNGMGSRASLVAPWAASHLYDYMYQELPLPAEMDIERFS